MPNAKPLHTYLIIQITFLLAALLVVQIVGMTRTPSTKTPVTKWEYKAIGGIYGAGLETRLNEFGVDGWELITATRGTQRKYDTVLRRPVDPSRPKKD